MKKFWNFVSTGWMVTVWTLLLGGLVVGVVWFFMGAGHLSAKSDVTGKVTPLAEAGENTNLLVNEAYEAGVEKSGTEVVPQGEVLAYMLSVVETKSPKCLGPKQRAVILKKIADLNAAKAAATAAAAVSATPPAPVAPAPAAPVAPAPAPERST